MDINKNKQLKLYSLVVILKTLLNSLFSSCSLTLYKYIIIFISMSMNFILKHKILTCLDKAVYSSSALRARCFSRARYMLKCSNVCGLSENFSLNSRLLCFSGVFACGIISSETYRLISRIISWVPPWDYWSLYDEREYCTIVVQL